MDLPVLVLEKEPQLRSLIRAILSKHGFRILEARDRLTALASVKALDGAMTVIVSSFSMPELNGDAFARIVKADFPDTPVLLMVSGATESGKAVYTTHSKVSANGNSLSVSSKGVNPVGQTVDATVAYDKQK
jgi:CheY-like chemotaxis protein